MTTDQWKGLNKEFNLEPSLEIIAEHAKADIEEAKREISRQWQLMIRPKLIQASFKTMEGKIIVSATPVEAFQTLKAAAEQASKALAEERAAILKMKRVGRDQSWLRPERTRYRRARRKEDKEKGTWTRNWEAGW